MEIKIIEKSTNYDELPRLILLLILALLAIAAFIQGVMLEYFFVVAVGFLIYCSWVFHKYKATSKWDKVEANIVDYKLICLKKFDYDPKILMHNYEVQITYKYTYKGNEYESNRVALDKSRYRFGEKKNRAIEYITGLLNEPTLYAYVNPNKENESVLDKKMSNQTLSDCTLCLMLSVVSMSGIVYFRFW